MDEQMGYAQYIDNLVYYAIIGLTIEYDLKYWQQLVDTINYSSVYYNKNISLIYMDYSNKLEQQLRYLANVPT
jgi:hypothetical protein